MGRWRPLQGGLPVEVVRLVRELRRHMDRCEMGTATVAAKTGYSRSSWLRYLNARRLPPWPAVEGLGRLAQADTEHLRVLWESAAHAWTQEGTTGDTAPPPAAGRRAEPAKDSRAAGSGSGPAGGRRAESVRDAGAEGGGSAPAAADRSARRDDEPAASGRRASWRNRRPPWPDRRPPWPDPLPPRPNSLASSPGPRSLPSNRRVFWSTPRLPRVAVVAAAAAGCALVAGVLLPRPWGAGVDAGRPPDGAPSGAPAWPWPLQSAAGGAAACRSAGCRGLDPYREGCDRDSVAVHRLRAYGHVLTLQYSPACLASWAEVDTPEGTARLRIAATGGYQQTATAGGAYTAMVGSGPDAARATVVVAGHQLGVARYDSWLDPVTGSGSR